MDMPQVSERGTDTENTACNNQADSVRISQQLLFDLLREAISARRAMLSAQNALRQSIQTQDALLELLRIEKLKE
jgi:hypothetical protein